MFSQRSDEGVRRFKKGEVALDVKSFRRRMYRDSLSRRIVGMIRHRGHSKAIGVVVMRTYRQHPVISLLFIALSVMVVGVLFLKPAGVVPFGLGYDVDRSDPVSTSETRVEWKRYSEGKSSLFMGGYSVESFSQRVLDTPDNESSVVVMEFDESDDDIYDHNLDSVNPNFCRELKFNIELCGKHLLNALLFPSHLGNIPHIGVLLRQYLQRFDQMAEKNGLEYFLYGSTLAGVFSQGDIHPWADSLEVAMAAEGVMKLKGLSSSMQKEGFGQVEMEEGRLVRVFGNHGVDYGYSWKWPYVDVFQFNTKNSSAGDVERRGSGEIEFIERHSGKRLVFPGHTVLPWRKAGAVRDWTKGDMTTFNIPRDPYAFMSILFDDNDWAEGVVGPYWNHVENQPIDNANGTMIPVRLLQKYVPSLSALVVFGHTSEVVERGHLASSKVKVKGLKLEETYNALVSNVTKGYHHHNHVIYNRNLSSVRGDVGLGRRVDYIGGNSGNGMKGDGLIDAEVVNEGNANYDLVVSSNNVLVELLRSTGSMKVDKIREGTGLVLFYSYRDVLCEKRVVYSTWLRASSDGVGRDGKKTTRRLMLCDLVLVSSLTMGVSVLPVSLSCREGIEG